ncbi:unnamed protein product [Phytophthora fragariaefolia]|uniref:Unnamed protein product n=1 Tax=Phytophthora fragariaefolia TaxID=1490495 RepID=A0A9W7CTZ7_9STRA|nr:unnamed protein product [Phytophthora fragariaefolia]
MADRHRRFDDFESRGRSQSRWRPEPRPRWGSASPTRHRRSPSPDPGRYPARSQSPARWARYRNRSLSPPSRAELAARRSRSRSPSPRSNRTTETLEQRRRRLLAEKTMSIDTYHRLLKDPHSPWSKRATGSLMPIPVPLEANENAGDYQHKFEFWLAQRGVSLASLQDDVIRERSYRCGYAQWRVQMGFGHKTDYAYGPQRAHSNTLARTTQEQETEQRLQTRPRSPARNLVHQGVPQSSRPSRFYDARSARRHDEEKIRTPRGGCKNCDRDWADLNRRLMRLESIVSRFDLRTVSTLDGTSSSPYEIKDYSSLCCEEASHTSNYIDLTDDVEGEAEGESEMSNPDRKITNITDTEPRSIEITPTDSDINHDCPSTTTDLGEAATQPVHDDNELKMPPELALLIESYNQVNDEALAKQKEAAADSLAKVEDEGEVSGVEHKSQLCKLRESIKEKRDYAVAAIMVCSRARNKDIFEREMKDMATSDAYSEQGDLHEKCAGIAAKLAEKEKELARLKKQLQSVSSLEESDSAFGQREAQYLFSKIGLERASKVSLETERQKIFTRLMKLSPQIQALVAKELSRKS